MANEPAPLPPVAGGTLGAVEYEHDLQLEPGMLAVMPYFGCGSTTQIWRVVMRDGELDGELVAVVGDSATAERLVPKGWRPRQWGSDSYWKKAR